MEKNIVIIRGDTFSFGMKFKGLEQALDDAHFLVSSTFEAPYHIDLSLGNGIELVETTEDHMTYRVLARPSDTMILAGAGVYNYSCKVKVSGNEYTLLHGVATFIDVVEEGE